MNRTQIEQEVKNLEAQLEEKRKQLEAMPKRWRAKVNECYYFVNSLFYTSSSQHNSIADDSLFNTHNYFQTKEEAEAMAEKTKLMFEMTARVKELNGDWVADLENSTQEKWGIDMSTMGVIIQEYYSAFHIFGLSVLSKEHAEILLNEFKERIERWY